VSASGPVTGAASHPQDDVVALAFVRAADAEEAAHAGGAAAPPLAAVRTRARRVRARRRAGAVLTAAAAAVTMIVGVSLQRTPAAAPPAKEADVPAGRFLRPADLGPEAGS